MREREDRLNTHFAQSEFKLDEGEGLLKEMQAMRDELSRYEEEVQRLINAAQGVVPLRARRWGGSNFDFLLDSHINVLFCSFT